MKYGGSIKHSYFSEVIYFSLSTHSWTAFSPPNSSNRRWQSLHRGEESKRLAMELDFQSWFDIFYSLAKQLKSMRSKMSLPQMEPTTDFFFKQFSTIIEGWWGSGFHLISDEICSSLFDRRSTMTPGSFIRARRNKKNSWWIGWGRDTGKQHSGRKWKQQEKWATVALLQTAF